MCSFLIALGLTLLATSPPPVAAHADTIPGEGTWGLRFALPEGGGGSLGVAHFLSERTSLGLEVDFTISDSEVTNGPTGGSTESSGWEIGLTPELRRYVGERRAVMPFVVTSLSVLHRSSTSGNGNLEVSTWTTAFRAGLGAEWFPTEWVGISGSTGVHAIHGTTENERLEPPGRVESSEWRLGVFRSDLFLSLYF